MSAGTAASHSVTRHVSLHSLHNPAETPPPSRPIFLNRLPLCSFPSSRAAALRSARDRSAKRETHRHDDHENNQSHADVSRSKSPHASRVSQGVSQQRAAKSPSRLAGSKTTIFPPNAGALPSQDKEQLKKWMLKVRRDGGLIVLWLVHRLNFFPFFSAVSN